MTDAGGKIRKGIAVTAFTQQGRQLAEQLRASFGKENCSLRDEKTSLKQWTAEAFDCMEALIFIGAAGIAVRTVAPLLKSKAEDPAVVVLDETGQHVIPLVSGHLGGANALARRIAEICGSVPVITTATDLHQAFAVDLWAQTQQMLVLQPERIRSVSGKILKGETITIGSPWEPAGASPENVQICRYSLFPEEDGTGSVSEPGWEDMDAAVTVRSLPGKPLHLVPKVLTLGIGCRRGTTPETIQTAFRDFCSQRNILPEAVCQAASIDLKEKEEGLLSFCRGNGWNVRFFTAEELAEVPGTYTGSAFVQAKTGVDNVCERSAVRASGGILLEKKYAADGVTLALAVSEPELTWEYV